MIPGLADGLKMVLQLAFPKKLVATGHLFGPHELEEVGKLRTL
jgi:hypothetical protein